MKCFVVAGLVLALSLSATGCSNSGLSVDINKDAVKSAVSSGVDTAKFKVTNGYEDLKKARNRISGIVSDAKSGKGLTEETVQTMIEEALEGTGIEKNVKVELVGKNYEVTVTDDSGNTLVSMKLAKDSDLLSKESRDKVIKQIKDFVGDVYSILYLK